MANQPLARKAKREQKATRSTRRRLSDNPRHAVYEDNFMDEPQLENSRNAGPDGVVFGVYGLDDWVTNTYLRNAVEKGMNTLSLEGTWITPSSWKLHEWVTAKAERFNFMSANRALAWFSWGMIELTLTSGKLCIELNGTPEEVVAFVASVDGEMKRAENLIEWIYNTKGDSISVPLNYRAAVPGAYPWLPTEIGEYIDGYMNSNASVLVLIGPPGTGKTSFIKQLIHRSGSDAKITYDEKVMSDDSLFAGFVEDDAKFLIMEDADAFLKSRADGNTMMHRFLNVSDGLISARDKKLVFSTNLPSIRDIDDALLRAGRCYDVIEFRALTRAEAEPVAAELGLELRDGAEFTLAELFNEQPSSGRKNVRKVGFV